jgi:hypothetical protein
MISTSKKSVGSVMFLKSIGTENLTLTPHLISSSVMNLNGSVSGSSSSVNGGFYQVGFTIIFGAFIVAIAGTLVVT